MCGVILNIGRLFDISHKEIKKGSIEPPGDDSIKERVLESRGLKKLTE